MRHLVKTKKLSRHKDARRALIRNQLVSLINEGQIITTLPKAKVIKSKIDRIISYAIKGDLASRRQVLKIIPIKKVVHKLFAEIASKFDPITSKGGYARVLKLGYRRGDGAELALLTIGEPVIKIKEKEEKKKGK